MLLIKSDDTSSDIPENKESQKPENNNKVKVKKRSPVAAGLLTFFFPLLGYLYVGKPKKGIIVQLILYCFTFLIFLIAALFFSLIPLILASIMSIGIYIYLIVETSEIAKREGKNYVIKPYNKWYIYVGIYIIFGYIIHGVYIDSIKKFYIEAYKIPTGAMEETILIGDYLIANKFYYGLQNPFTKGYLVRVKEPSRGDIVIFTYYDHESGEELPYIKRCVGIAGDNIQIIDKVLYINEEKQNLPPNAIISGMLRKAGEKELGIFPPGAPWNEDNYGPLRIPAKGDVIVVNLDNYHLWKRFIQNEGHEVRLDADEIIVDGYPLVNGEYTVEQDYLFVMGDNRSNSYDSRFWGFVNYDDILGKAGIIYFSKDPVKFDIRYDRIGKEIK